MNDPLHSDANTIGEAWPAVGWRGRMRTFIDARRVHPSGGSMIDTGNGTARLLDFVPGLVMPADSLMALTGDTAKARRSLFASGLMKSVAEAWVTPLTEITCGMCRMLVGQGLGLKWLSAPAASFVARYPMAECDLYPGDLSVVSLIAWREFHCFAPDECLRMIRSEFQWLVAEAGADDWEMSIVKEAVAALVDARNKLGDVG